jgi:RNA polymerase sigma-70 factor (ECF subfamily)
MSAPRSEPPSFTTSTDLLRRLGDPRDEAVWHEYVGRYRPLLLSYARRLRFAAEDAEDLAQITLAEFCRTLREGKYERARGRLRSWLFGIAQRLVRKQRDRLRREPVPLDVAVDARERAAAERADDHEDLEEIWEQEWRESVLRACLDQVRREVSATTYDAFRLFVREARPARDVAEELGVSENAVFGAKRRVLGRIRALLPEIEECW